MPPRGSGHACAPPSRAPSRRIGDPRGWGAPTDTGSPVAPPLKFPRGPEGQKPPRAPPGPRRSGTRGPLLSGGVGATGTPASEAPGELGCPRPSVPGAKLLPSPPSGTPGAASPRARRELATFAVLWKLARRHHQEITLSCSRPPRRRPQSEAHGEPDTRTQTGRGPEHVACQVKPTHTRAYTYTHTHTKRKEKELGASCSGLSRRLHPNDSAPRAGHGPPSRDARTHATGDQTGGELRGCRDRWLWPECKGPRAARSLSQTRPSGLGQQRHAACVAQPRRWPSPAVLSPAWPPAPGGGKLKFPSSGFVVHPRAKPSRAPR